MSSQERNRKSQHAIRNGIQMMVAIDRQLEVALDLLGRGKPRDCAEVLEDLRAAIPNGIETLSANLERENAD